MKRDVVIALCNYTTNFVEPWAEAGYLCIMVDPQHTVSHREGGYWKACGTVESEAPWLGNFIRNGRVAFVAGFPPCTDMAVSGARWFEEKRKKDPMFQAKAVSVAEQCRMIGMLSGARWMVENPVSVLSSVFGKPDHTFDPFHYTAYCEEDNYRKKTCLWTGGGFMMPPPSMKEGLPPPDQRIHTAPPGKDRANFRSATPRGFARAVAVCNMPYEGLN